MTTPAPLPSLAGLAWSRHKKPGFSTRVSAHSSGREVRVPLYVNPLYEFEAVYAGLASASTAAFAGLGSSSLQSLMGFFLQLQGQYGTFLYADPDDNAVTGQIIAAGDGTTQSFVMGRTLGGFNEPCSWVTNVTDVYLNGTPLSSVDWLFTAPNSIGLATAPGAGVEITADFTFAFQCRFLDDQMDFEEFMSGLWKLDSMKFRSIKANTVPSGNIPTWYSPYAIGGVNPTVFADATTEGGANHYLYNGTSYGSFAALLTALGITFSRASTAYYTNSSGLLASASSGVVRFDYRGGGPVGILLESASTNLALQSNGFGTSPWAQLDCSVAQNATGPDGVSNGAWTLTATASGFVLNYQDNITTSASSGAVSAFAKAGTATYVFLSLYIDGTRKGTFFNLSTGTVASQNVGVSSTTTLTNAAIVSLANGWYRISTEFANTAGSGAIQGEIGLANSISLSGGVNGTTAGLYGYQFETLPFASSYVPTTSSAASRAADSLSAATWPAIAAGTLYANADTLYAGQAQRIIQIDDGTANNRATLEFNASAAGEFDFLDGGAPEAALTAGTVTANTLAQLAAAFQANDFVLVANGGTPATASSGGIPAFSKLRIGADSSGNNPLLGHLAQFGVWNNLRGPNANLQGLT